VSSDVADEGDRNFDVGSVSSHPEAVTPGVEELADRERRRQIGQAIVDGYTRIPQTDEEIEWADAATREMILEEPW
jgi:hypothetical protein